ncbi:putative nucleotide-diphospho-sugar transferase [Falsiroseomonas selenitidurans]|uniref:Glycosyltransferase family 77 protein n=1 Tax=Falsiroseomonas selenitidurans TaxID=2716335 RepID=A0ABX1EAP8_9PROT|nr:putative nucleotide-diphospho-sugar transferase [Falsiroseomonas selenitidurans]NKC34269.1 glycosyltransferase family 77 protein [Falsiroseomonas selenitidurans]
MPAALAGLGRPGLLPVVFADARRYGAVLENWLRHAARAGVAETLVVALDDATEAACRGHPGLGVVGLRHDGTMASLWALRLRLFATLAREGVAFIHSDADAVWLADPRPSLAESPGELVFSLGAVWPQAAHADWGFVLCCGLLAARPAPAVSAFLDGLAAEAEGGQPDDQVLLNHRLLAAGTTWDWSGVPRRERPSATRCWPIPRARCLGPARRSPSGSGPCRRPGCRACRSACLRAWYCTRSRRRSRRPRRSCCAASAPGTEDGGDTPGASGRLTGPLRGRDCRARPGLLAGAERPAHAAQFVRTFLAQAEAAPAKPCWRYLAAGHDLTLGQAAEALRASAEPWERQASAPARSCRSSCRTMPTRRPRCSAR